MTLEEAISTLERYQSWRLGDNSEMLEPKVITMAIDTVLRNVKEMKAKQNDFLPNGGFVAHDSKDTMRPTKENDKV